MADYERRLRQLETANGICTDYHELAAAIRERAETLGIHGPRLDEEAYKKLRATLDAINAKGLNEYESVKAQTLAVIAAGGRNAASA